MRAERGFALLEVLIASAIAAMALGILFETAGTGGVAVRNAGYYEEAVSRAKSHMAALDSVSLTEGEQSGDDGGNYRWRIKVSPIATVAPAPNNQPAARGASRFALYAVEVAISWTIDGRTRQVVLHTQRLGLRAETANG
jgi:general secretion pathway protein I